jgi:hypothetical protein
MNFGAAIGAFPEGLEIISAFPFFYNEMNKHQYT